MELSSLGLSLPRDAHAPPTGTTSGDVARPLFAAYMSEMLKYTGVEKVFGDTGYSAGLSFVATNAIADQLARPGVALYDHWLAQFAGHSK